jgi:hypothetical protein
MLQDRQYLGDGVYAEHDGYQVWLSITDGITTSDLIALDPDVFAALLRYRDRVFAPQPARTGEEA